MSWVQRGRPTRDEARPPRTRKRYPAWPTASTASRRTLAKAASASASWRLTFRMSPFEIVALSPLPPFGRRVGEGSYDLGIAFFGSMKGFGTTRAARSPQGVATVRLVPGSASATGTIAYPTFFFKRGEWIAEVTCPT